MKSVVVRNPVRTLVFSAVVAVYFGIGFVGLDEITNLFGDVGVAYSAAQIPPTQSIAVAVTVPPANTSERR